MAVAQDTGGEEAAGPWYDRAEASFTTLIDTAHTVTALYGLVNVPTAVWIDERGRIVRPPEVAWSEPMDFGVLRVGDERYVPALRDWVARGTESAFVVDAQARRRRQPASGADRRLADAHFRLAAHLLGAGASEAAREHWAASHRLAPDNWNAHRQAWYFLAEDERRRLWRDKFERLGERPYYEPLQLP